MAASATRPAGARQGILRLLVGYAAILGTVPYLVLKISWVTGGTLGLTDPELVDTPTMYAANLFTGGMDAVAILLALAWTHSWGLRVPAPPLLFPIWVGTGFLAPIAIAGPFIGTEFVLGAPTMDGLAGWVTPLVYGSFAWQGCTLLTAFVLYARVRWAWLFTARAVGGPLTAPGVVGVAAGLVTGCLHLAWALGLPTGEPGGRGLAAHALDAVQGLLTFGAVGAILLLAAGGHRVRLPMVLAWTGSAVMFAWGFWGVAGTGALTGGLPELADLALPLLVYAAQCLAGALLGFALVRRLALLPEPAAAP
ncbi:hypothetical protein [Amycolatopsis cihanbeyliensis]|uniref:Uncharacterized protein n=1 Tax=Amycolatopsis cihanbeyliensis TaxID=1128664 RepID=A0A542DL81_AMYCI|nr:hypothetical protein [Amycolatopsis cihanbeyliensis]TQJ03823.1 hypothetical protein FB471_3591 [Amycolatopsis cihanbeyliensis]